MILPWPFVSRMPIFEPSHGVITFGVFRTVSEVGAPGVSVFAGAAHGCLSLLFKSEFIFS
jgi:hypothetical protein